MSDTLRSLFTGSAKSDDSQGSSSPAGASPAGSGSSSSSTGTARSASAKSSASTREVKPDVAPGADIRVLGTGGGGANAIKRMVDQKLEGIEFIAVNTDVQALYHNPASKKITIGRGIELAHLCSQQ